MKTLFAATVIALVALTATAATLPSVRAPEAFDEATVNAKIDARQNELMKALLSAKRAAAVAHASR